jgi:ubiquinone/menaquinone biosynthesis C-methylase UbiE
MATLSYPAKTAYQSKKAAESYDVVRFKSLKGKWADKREKKIIGELLNTLPPESKVMDLACGTGRISEFLLSKGYKVWGIDISSEMLRVAKGKLSSFENSSNFQQADAENLPFENKFFDSATCIKLFGHVPPETRIKILQEIRRVTKGPFVVAYYLSGSITDIKRKIKKFITDNKAPWFPISKSGLRKEIPQANLRILNGKSVLKGFSETLILLLD